tara:strand:- start:3500 stop:4330 length:831 start_codon:yes stop_codon:yes gene_type:complete
VVAQSTIVSSELDTTQGYIGDVVNWTVLVDNAENRRIQFPELFLQNDTVSVRTQKLLYNKGIVTGITFELVFWDTGKFQTPEYQVDILNDSDTVISSIAPEPIELTILSLLTTTGNSDFRPIKGPVPVRSVFPLRLTVLGILAVILIAFIYWTWNQRINVKYQRTEYLISESPREKAIRRLGELNINGFAKDYYAELSHISREYVEYSTFIRALEMTTEEIDENRNLFPINDKMFADWVKSLSIADLVKYAREIPDSTQMELDHQKIISFIERSFV